MTTQASPDEKKEHSAGYLIPEFLKTAWFIPAFTDSSSQTSGTQHPHRRTIERISHALIVL